MRILSDSELEEILLTGLNRARLISLRTYNTMFLQYHTGVRLSEVMVDRWEILPNGTYYLNTRKYNQPRTFTPDQIPLIWREAIALNDDSLFCNVHSTYERRFREIFSTDCYTVGEKRLVSHIWRHNWAKKERIKLGSNEAVRQSLGEKRLSSALNYIASDIVARPWQTVNLSWT